MFFINYVYGWWYASGHVTIMLYPNDHDYYNCICCIIQYVQSHNCIHIIVWRNLLYESFICLNKIHLFFLSIPYNKNKKLR